MCIKDVGIILIEIYSSISNIYSYRSNLIIIDTILYLCEYLLTFMAIEKYI